MERLYNRARAERQVKLHACSTRRPHFPTRRFCDPNPRMTRRTKAPPPAPPTPPDELPPFTPVPRQCARHDGWTPQRQRAFIEALADTGSVAAACKAVSMSTNGAYQPPQSSRHYVERIGPRPTADQSYSRSLPACQLLRNRLRQARGFIHPPSAALR
jgi:hypothetical protein